MKIDDSHSDEAILKEIGERIARYRLNENQTQSSLATEAGVSERTLQRAENGQTIQATSLIRILRALGLTKNLEALIPQPAVSPVQQLKRQGKKRKRASSVSNQSKEEIPWSWGENE
ncbi:MAG: helix-turn-helix transcriptional regulator [Pyrinomonadaceae bacterium]